MRALLCLSIMLLLLVGCQVDIQDPVTGILVPVVVMMISIASTWFLQERKASKEIDQLRQAFIKPVQIPTGDRRNSIILVGLGGTGKTTIIKNLLNAKDAKPDERTKDYEIYSGYKASTLGDKNQDPEKCWFYISDYLGQNVGQLISSFIQQQKRTYSSMAYGYVNSLILIVDLWPAKKNRKSEDLPKQSRVDVSRIRQNDEQWNDTALDAIFGLLTANLKYVVLFINKVDLLTQRSDSAEKKVMDRYDKLINRLRKRADANGVKFSVILGSARYGTGMTKILEELINASVLSE